MSDTQIIAMPLVRFWLFSEMIDRIDASEDMRSIANSNAIASKDSMQERIESLNSTMGTIIIKDYVRDSESVSRMKKMLLT